MPKLRYASKIGADGWGTEKDNSKSEKYCIMCYENGKFINSKIDSAEKIQDFVFDILRQRKIPKFLVKLMIKDIPKLERWK